MSPTTMIERAAGGLVVRVRDGIREVLLIDDRYGKVSFPKGHLETKESWEEAALREVQEETGIEARILAPLGRVEYMIEQSSQSIRKQVRLFFMEAIHEDAVPVPQMEELPAAYYVPWEEAVTAVNERGYDNWKWIMERASVEFDWYYGQWEEKWRKLPSNSPFLDVMEVWKSFRSLFDRMLHAVREELTACVPEWSRRFPEPRGLQLPNTMPDEQLAMANAIEHTVLKPEATVVDVERVCDEAAEHNFHAVCINPQHVAAAAARLKSTDVAVCTVVGFPLGATDTRALQAEVEAVITAGAKEIDMVIPIGSMVEDDVWAVYQHVAAVTDEAHFSSDVTVKVILETYHLTYAQVIKACLVAVAAGADYVKTSTGFAPSGARLADVAAMIISVGNAVGVKAAGGIKDRTAALNFLRLGARRLGTSASVHLLRESRDLV